MEKISSKLRLEVGQKLVIWFQKNQRDLPWRKTYDPYAVWVSEIMLQQTQVKTVLPYYNRWIRELPDIESVAQASEDRILKLWEGLGYYSRARNMQKAAKVIISQHKGAFPDKFNDILDLPGIGRYTAGAISSITFNQNRPLVDGNVIRVLARLFGFTKNTRLQPNIDHFWKWAEELIPKSHARDFNQGMMELGALVCMPKNPKCGQCPWKTLCQARKKGIQSEIPNRGEGKKLIPIRVTLAVIWKNGKVFIQKRPSHGLMGGLWEFPCEKAASGESDLKTLNRKIGEGLGIKLKNIKRISQIHHGYTKYDVDLRCFTADFSSGKIRPKAATESKWVSPKSLARYAFPAANRKLIDKLIG